MGFLAFGHGLKEDINPSESLTEPYPASVTDIQDSQVQRGRKIQLIQVLLHDTPTDAKKKAGQCSQPKANPPESETSG